MCIKHTHTHTHTHMHTHPSNSVKALAKDLLDKALLVVACLGEAHHMRSCSAARGRPILSMVLVNYKNSGREPEDAGVHPHDFHTQTTLLNLLSDKDKLNLCATR